MFRFSVFALVGYFVVSWILYGGGLRADPDVDNLPPGKPSALSDVVLPPVLRNQVNETSAAAADALKDAIGDIQLPDVPLFEQEKLPPASPNAPEPGLPPAIEAPLSIVAASRVNLRAGPSMTDKVVSVLAFGDAVETGQVEGQWIEVALEDGRAGWMAARYIEDAKAVLASHAERG